MMRPLSLLKASSRRTSSSTGAAAVPIRAYSSLDDTEGILASMRNLLGKRALRRAWTVSPSDGEPAFSPHAELTQRATSFVVQTTPLVGGASHFQRFQEGIVNCDDRLDESSPTQRNTRRHRQYDQEMVGSVCARHFSSPLGVRQRLTAWQLTGRLSNARNILAC